MPSAPKRKPFLPPVFSTLLSRLSKESPHTATLPVAILGRGSLRQCKFLVSGSLWPFSRKTCDGETDSELDKFQPPQSPCCVTWITCLTSPSLVCRWEDHHVPHGMMLRVTGHLCLKLQVHCNCT